MDYVEVIMNLELINEATTNARIAGKAEAYHDLFKLAHKNSDILTIDDILKQWSKLYK